MKRPLRHLFDYLVLSLVMSVAIILILFFNGSRFFQMIIIVSTSVIYVLWGIGHHHKEGTLHQKVVLEYLLYAILGTALVLGLL